MRSNSIENRRAKEISPVNLSISPATMAKQTTRGVRRNKRGTYRISPLIHFRTIADVKRRLRRYKQRVSLEKSLPGKVMREVLQIFHWFGITPPAPVRSLIIQRIPGYQYILFKDPLYASTMNIREESTSPC